MDLWALGAVLYEAATGQAPWTPATHPAGRTYPQLTRPPAPLRDHSPGLPAALQDMIIALLQHDPARRPPTAMAALHACPPACQPTRKACGPPGQTTSSHGPAQRRHLCRSLLPRRRQNLGLAPDLAHAGTGGRAAHRDGTA